MVAKVHAGEEAILQSHVESKMTSSCCLGVTWLLIVHMWHHWLWKQGQPETSLAFYHADGVTISKSHQSPKITRVKTCDRGMAAITGEGNGFDVPKKKLLMPWPFRQSKHNGMRRSRFRDWMFNVFLGNFSLLTTVHCYQEIFEVEYYAGMKNKDILKLRSTRMNELRNLKLLWVRSLKTSRKSNTGPWSLKTDIHRKYSRHDWGRNSCVYWTIEKWLEPLQGEISINRKFDPEILLRKACWNFQTQWTHKENIQSGYYNYNL